MQRLKLRIEESGEKLSAAYAPPKWSETAGKVITYILFVLQFFLTY